MLTGRTGRLLARPSRLSRRGACRVRPFDEQDRDVVMPGRIVAPPLDTLHNGVQAFVERRPATLFQRGEEPPYPEVLAVRVPRLRHAVGVEHEPVSRP